MRFRGLTESTTVLTQSAAAHSPLRFSGSGRFCLKEIFMETRVAVIGIIVEDMSSVSQLNSMLSEFGQYIIGRMGLPYQKRGIHIISLAVDAPQDVISSLGGRLGRLPGVSAKTAYANV